MLSESDGKTLAGLLFVPKDFDATQKYPALTVTRPASRVKEQTALHLFRKSKVIKMIIIVNVLIVEQNFNKS